MGQGDENLDQDVILKFIQVITCSTSSQSFLQIISLFNQAFLIVGIIIKSVCHEVFQTELDLELTWDDQY